MRTDNAQASPDISRWLGVDLLLSKIRLEICTLGAEIAAGVLDVPDAVGILLDGPVAKACEAWPELWDVYDDIEATLDDDLFAISNGIEQRLEQSRVQAAPGPHAHYPAPSEPREVVLDRQAATIRDTVATGARIAGARRKLELLRDAEIEHLDDPTPADKAVVTRRLHKQVAAQYGYGARIPLPPRLLATGGQGTGKSARTLEAIAGIRERITVVYTAPTIVKCDELARDYAGLRQPDSLRALVVRGRAQPDPDRPGLAMCQRHEVAEEVASRGLSVPVVLCAACPFRDACGHREQAATIKSANGVGLFFMAGAGVFVSSPVPHVGLFIGDERLDPTDIKQIPLTALTPDLLPEFIGAQANIRAIAEAMGQPHQLAAMRTAGIDRDALRHLIRLLTPDAIVDASHLSGDLADAEIKERLDALPDNRAADALTLLRAILREFDQPRPMLNGIVAESWHPEMLSVCRLRSVRGISKAGVLLLDGTGDIVLNRSLFGDSLRHQEFRIERDATVTGTDGRGYSRQSLTAIDLYGHAMPGLEASAKKLRAEIGKIVDRAAEGRPDLCLVIAPMAAELALEDDLPYETQTTHYGDLRGKNSWERCLAVVSVGQTNLGIRALEAIARCYLADDAQPFGTADVPVLDDDGEPVKGWPYHEVRQRRMRDGTLLPVEVAVHPDPRVQRVLEQIRECEVVQSIDRVRPVFNRRSITLLNSLCVDVTYDRILRHRELVDGGTRWDRAWAATGIIPLGARDLHDMHHAIFRTPPIGNRGRSPGNQAGVAA